MQLCQIASNIPGTELEAHPKETRLDLEDGRLLYFTEAKGSLGLGTGPPSLSSDVPGHLLPPWLGLGQGERDRSQFVKLLYYMRSIGQCRGWYAKTESSPGWWVVSQVISVFELLYLWLFISLD